MASLLQRFYVEIGLKTLIASPADTKILCLQRLVRLFAYGGSTLILALYLSALGNSDEKIGLFMTLTLLGDVVISLILTVIADGIGRRRMLGLGSLLMTASGIVFATCSNYWVLVAASVLGVISPRYVEFVPPVTHILTLIVAMRLVLSKLSKSLLSPRWSPLPNVVVSLPGISFSEPVVLR